MGFKTAKMEQSKPRIQLIISVNGNKLKSPVKDIDEADALALPVAALNACKTTCGYWLQKGSVDEAEKTAKAGADFVIVPVSGEVLPFDKKLGKILQIETSITDILLRTASALPVDAVLLAEEGDLSLNWKRLMLIHRFSSLAGKPLLVEVIPAVTENELQQVWEAGVSGVLVRVEAEEAQSTAVNLRQVIDKLSFPVKKKNDKNLAIVPHIASQPEETHEDDDDGDDGEDE
jgi:hypothetical protein